MRLSVSLCEGQEVGRSWPLGAPQVQLVYKVRRGGETYRMSLEERRQRGLLGSRGVLDLILRASSPKGSSGVILNKGWQVDRGFNKTLWL